MKSITVEFDVSPWLDEDGFTVCLFAGASDEALGINFSLEELIDREIEAHTVAERTKAKAVWEQAYRQGYKDGQATGG